MTNIDYSTVAHEVMYRNIHNGDGAPAVMETAREWKFVADELNKINEDVAKVIREIFSVHEGSGAEAARGAMMPLVPWAQAAAEAATARSRRVSQQADALGYVRDTMPPPIPRTEFSAMEFAGALAGPDAAAMGAQNRASVEAEERARQLMTSYQSTSNGLLDNPERFEQAPVVVAEVGPMSVGQHGGGVSAGGGGGVPHVASAAAAAPVPVSAQAAGPPPPPGSPVPVMPAASVGPVPGFGTYAPGANQPRPIPVMPAAALPPGGRGGGGVGRAGGGVRGGGGGSGRLPGAAPVGPGPGAPVGEAVGRAAAASGRAGMPGAAMGGAGAGARGRGGEDEEHQRPSYLVEEDENALVGKLDPVAPPVIGRPEWQDDDG